MIDQSYLVLRDAGQVAVDHAQGVAHLFELEPARTVKWEQPHYFYRRPGGELFAALPTGVVRSRYKLTCRVPFDEQPSRPCGTEVSTEVSTGGYGSYVSIKKANGSSLCNLQLSSAPRPFHAAVAKETFILELSSLLYCVIPLWTRNSQTHIFSIGYTSSTREHISVVFVAIC